MTILGRNSVSTQSSLCFFTTGCKKLFLLLQMIFSNISVNIEENDLGESKV